MLEKGIDLIQTHIGLMVHRSKYYETEPWGVTEQDNFINIAINVRTALNPEAILKAIKSIEIEVGREKIVHWGPRVLDIDILFYGDEIYQAEGLIIPHKEIQNRNFVLIPLLENNAELIHPKLDKSIEELYLESKDSCEVWLFENELKD